QLATAQRWLGFREGKNNDNPFSSWQGYPTPFLPWCDSFANYCAVQGGGFVWPDFCQFGAKGDGYVPYSEEHAQRMGIWKPSSAVARPGWQVIYDWQHDGIADHIETVVADDGHNLATIGGNTSDAVLYRRRTHQFVVGFAA